jgi:hypothetical protein
MLNGHAAIPLLNVGIYTVIAEQFVRLIISRPRVDH